MEKSSIDSENNALTVVLTSTLLALPAGLTELTPGGVVSDGVDIGVGVGVGVGVTVSVGSGVSVTAAVGVAAAVGDTVRVGVGVVFLLQPATKILIVNRTISIINIIPKYLCCLNILFLRNIAKESSPGWRLQRTCGWLWPALPLVVYTRFDCSQYTRLVDVKSIYYPVPGLRILHNPVKKVYTVFKRRFEQFDRDLGAN